MSSTEPSVDENAGDSTFQRIAVAVGTLIIVVLTVVAALFLAAQDLPPEEPTAVVQISPTFTIPVSTSTPSPSLILSPTPTPSATLPPPSPTEATSTVPLPPPATATNTNTPLPPSPTWTSTPVVLIVTATPPSPTAPLVPPPSPAGGEGACQPPPSWVTYVVQTGDTLNSLASRTNTSVFELQQVNCLESFTLQVGQTIYLPFTPPTPTVTNTPSPTRRPGPSPTRSATPISPQIDSITPSRVDRETANEEVILTVLGRNFRPGESGFRVELRGPEIVELQLGQARSDTSFEAIVPPGLPLGTYALVVTNANGRAGVRQSAYTIGPTAATETPSSPPDIIRFTPTSGRISDEIELTIQGRNFRPNDPGFKVELQATDGSLEVELDLGDIRTDTNFEAIIRADTLQRGTYNLVVINPDGRGDIAADEYTALE